MLLQYTPNITPIKPQHTPKITTMVVLPEMRLAVKPANKVPVMKIEYGYGYLKIRSPYTPYSIYSRGTITVAQGRRGSVRISANSFL